VSEPLLAVDSLKVRFSSRTGILSQLFGEERYVRAVDGVSFRLERGEILGLAGESGCGKSTLSFTILRHYQPCEGRVAFDGIDVFSLAKKDLKAFRKSVQLIFQDPYQSLNPRFTVFRCVAEPLFIHGIRDRRETRDRAVSALRSSGLLPPEDFLRRYPHELSGGQRQRVAIARAIVLNPSLLVADEPVSMLDVSVRAGILNLFREFAKSGRVGILYVSHDLGTIRYICDRVAIMYLGRIVEIGPTAEVMQNPSHPYTRALIDSVPEIEPGVGRKDPELLEKFIEDTAPLHGCRFQRRCPLRKDECFVHEPEPVRIGRGHEVACHLYRTRSDAS